jgi:signal transduction histidine kinase
MAIALICTSLLVWSAYDFARGQARRQILDTARALSRVLDGEFARYELTLRALATSPNVLHHDWRAVDREARSIATEPGTWITLTDPMGREMVDTRAAGASGMTGGVRHLRTWPAIAGGMTHICDLEGSAAGERNLCVEIPVLQDRKPPFVLTIWLRPDTLSTVVARQRVPTDGHSTILDNHGAVVWRSHSPGRMVERTAEPALLKALHTSGEGVIPKMTEDGRQDYVAYSRSPSSGWTFVITVPRGQIDTGIWSGLTVGLALVAALMAIGAIASFRWLRGFTRAVDMLAQGAGALARRDQYHQPDTQIRELNDIAIALGDADRTLKLRDADLERMNASLADRVEAAVAEREIALRQLNETRKLETLGQLTGGVAHDFNNLLSPIMGSLEMLQIRMAGDVKNARLIDAALNSAERAKLLVSRLLSFSRRQALRPQAVDVAALVNDMADLISRSLGSSIRVAIEAEDGLPPAHVDRNQLELALLNLSVNARDAMPQGGTLSVSVSLAQPTTDEMPGATERDFIRIRLIDSGVGMDADTLAHAIEPFFTTKPREQGTGLGLSMVHGLAAQSGGAFALSSMPGAGTRADILLPVSKASSRAAKAPHRPSATPARILLVDDEEMVRGGIAEMLKDFGLNVTDIGSPLDALAMIRDGADIDCLITDYKMPAMDGGMLIAAARALRPNLPIVLMSGYSGREDDIAAVERLEKPFRQKHLIQAIEAAMTCFATGSRL